MLLLITSAHPTMLRWAHPHHGRLLTPRHYSAAAATAAAGIPWAADNDAYNDLDLDLEAFERMVQALAGLPGCRFVSVPDVVGDAWLTLHAYWEEYASLVRALATASGLRASRRHPGRRGRPLGLLRCRLSRRHRRLPALSPGARDVRARQRAPALAAYRARQ